MIRICWNADGVQDPHPTIDAISGNGGMCSLERPTGLRFLTRSRLYSDEALPPLPTA